MKSYLTQHANALRDACRRLVAAPLNTLLALLVIGVALALPSAGYVALDNLRELLGSSTGAPQISVFLQLDANRKDATEIDTRLRELKPGNWRFVPRDEALKRLQASAGMSDIVASLPKNPLPDAYVIEPTDTSPEAMDSLAAQLRTLPKVAHVQLDSAWVRRLDAFLRFGKLSVSLLAGLFAGALVASTFNTIRLQILAHANEIEVARLIGATDAFVRRPYLYFGTLQGALGGLFAAALVAVGLHLLSPPVAELVTLYGGNFTLRCLSPPGVGLHTAGGALLGWLGALLSLAIHLSHPG